MTYPHTDQDQDAAGNLSGGSASGSLKIDEHGGTVKWFCPVKGYGFIAADQQSLGGGKDIFLHSSALKPLGVPTIEKQARVAFTLKKDKAGRCLADSIRRL